MIPLHDDNPTTRRPYVTVALIAACVLAFGWQLSLEPQMQQYRVMGLGAIPAVVVGGKSLPPELYLVPSSLTLITSQFLHGGWMHLIGNMLYLWIFGNNIEDALGHGRFIVFYLTCGVLAALAHALSDPASPIPLIGASGAIAGALGAYLLLHPRARVLTLVPLFIVFWTFRLPAWLLLIFWFVIQFLNASAAGVGAGVAYWAHVVGFVVGIPLLFLLKPSLLPGFWRRW